MVIVTQATSVAMARKAAAAALVPIGRTAAAATVTMRRLATRLVDLPRDVRRPGGRPLVDGICRWFRRSVVLVQAGLRVPPPRCDAGPQREAAEDRHGHRNPGAGGEDVDDVG